MLRILFALMLLSLPAVAGAAADEKVVAGLSQNRVAITANFDGTGILIFGAVKRESPQPLGGPLQVVIAVAGPSHPVVVRRKERIFGIWVNHDVITVDAAPSFYAVASTVPLEQALSRTADLRYKVSINKMIRNVGEAGKTSGTAQKFTDAVIRIRKKDGLYSQTDGIVELTDDTLFQTQISLPANLVEGDYVARILLTRDLQVVDEYQTTIAVRKVGMERWIYNLAHERPLVYGLLSLFIAISAGWLASTAFRLLRLN